MVGTPRDDARWARGLAVALVTAPAVLVAQVVVADALPSLRNALVVCAVVAVVACAVPTRTAAGTALLAAGAQLAGHAVLALLAPVAPDAGGCLAVVGRGAGLSLEYAVVHDRACPPGSLATGPALAAVVAALAAAGVVLLAHALLATLTGVLVAAVATGLDAVARLAGVVLPALAGLLGVRLVPAGVPVPPLPEPPAPTGRWVPGRVLRRGPPAPLPAVA